MVLGGEKAMGGGPRRSELLYRMWGDEDLEVSYWDEGVIACILYAERTDSGNPWLKDQ